MSYYANGHGYLKLKVSADDIPESVKKIFGNVISVDYYDDRDKTYEISHPDYKYYSDDVMSALSIISPYISEGEIAFEGEDGSLWKFEFDPDNGWDELQGNIVYENETGLSKQENEVVAAALSLFGGPDARKILQKYVKSFK